MNQKKDITKLGLYLNRAFSAIVENFDHAMHEADIPLNHARFLILKTLENNKTETMSQRAIAIRLGKDPAAISRSLKLLEANGLIQRSAVNGCKNGVMLTEKYEILRPRINSVIEKVTTGFCAGLTEEVISSGLTFLRKVLDHHISTR